MVEVRTIAREAAPVVRGAVEYAATEDFVKFARNVLLVSMMGMMGYTLIKGFAVLSPAVEESINQVGRAFGVMIAIAIPIMVLVFVFSIIRLILRLAG